MSSPLLTLARALEAGELDHSSLEALRADPAGTRAQLNAVMEEILRLGPDCCENEDLVAQAFLVLPLLAELGNEECLDPLIRFMQLPLEAHDVLIGETGLELERTAFARCTHRNPERLVAVVTDGTRPIPYRRIALDALCHHTAYGRIPVADTVFAANAFLRQLIPAAQSLAGTKDTSLRDELEMAAGSLCDILPHAMRAELESVIQSKVCDPQFFGQGDLEHCLTMSDAENMDSYRLTTPDDASAEITLQDHLDELTEYERESAKPYVKPEPIRKLVKIGRNDPCPCGSGKKYKKCCDA